MKRSFVLVLLLFFITACGQKITDENFLIGGEWVGTAGYEDGEVKGGPNCYPFEEGMEFKDTDRVQNAIYDKDFEYRLFEDDGKSYIYFTKPSPGFGYQIKKIGENEIVLEGDTFEDHSCYFERE